MLFHEPGQGRKVAALSVKSMCDGIYYKKGEMTMNDTFWMQEAIKEAKLAYQEDEIPVGCIIVKDQKIIARAHNSKEKHNNSLHHAEINAIAQASAYLKDWRLSDCDMYVTLEPCLMCCGAIINARLRFVVYGAYDIKGGAVESLTHSFDIKGLNHKVNYLGGVLQADCAQLLKDYFKHKRDENHPQL